VCFTAAEGQTKIVKKGEKYDTIIVKKGAKPVAKKPAPKTGRSTSRSQRNCITISRSSSTSPIIMTKTATADHPGKCKCPDRDQKEKRWV
jgi:hypothetical protein